MLMVFTFDCSMYITLNDVSINQRPHLVGLSGYFGPPGTALEPLGGPTEFLLRERPRVYFCMVFELYAGFDLTGRVLNGV
jgi:hypothetical protein